MKLFFNNDGTLNLIAPNTHEYVKGFECVVVPDDLDISKKITFDDGAVFIAEVNREELNDRLSLYFSSKNYSKARAQEYPPIGDQLDALFKAGVFPADMAAAIQAVKDKYPKGTA